MKQVIAIAAISEAATGVALLIVPSLVGQLLLGAELTGIALIVARVTGIAQIALAVACWPDRSMRRAFQGMLTYSVLAMLYLIYVGVSGVAGILLWPGVAVHAVLSVLLILMWRKQQQAPERNT